MSDRTWVPGSGVSGDKGWSMKYVPWFVDPAMKIATVAFDTEGALYIGSKFHTGDFNAGKLSNVRFFTFLSIFAAMCGILYELSVLKMLSSTDAAGQQNNADLKDIFHLHGSKVS